MHVQHPFLCVVFHPLDGSNGLYWYIWTIWTILVYIDYIGIYGLYGLYWYNLCMIIRQLDEIILGRRNKAFKKTYIHLYFLQIII